MPKNNTSFNVKVETGQEVYGEILTLLRGYSPYELALKDGFVGTEEEWLASLVGEKGEVGDGIEDVVLNDDYTLTIFYTNGDQYTTPHSIRGETGATGNGIESATLNPDYSLTLLFTNGGSYTTIPIRGLQGERGLQGLQGIQGETGNGISRVKLNSDYTLTIHFTDGTSHTTSSIRGAQGEKGEAGNGIKYATMNPDYTLTIKYTDGSTYTTPVLRGAQGIQGMKGDVGNGIDSAVLNPDYTLTLNFTDGTSYTTASIRGQTGERGEQGVQGEPGNGISKTTLNSDYTLTLSFTDGSSYTTSSIRGMQGIQGIQGANGADGVGIASATMNQDYTLTLHFTDGTHYTTPSLRGATGSKGDKGDTGNGIDHVQLNNDYTLTLYFDDGTQYTTTSIRGEKGEKGDSGDSPTITTTKSGKRTTIYADDSPIGTVDDGDDGTTPSITASKSGSVTTISVNGNPIAEINDGTPGQDGDDGYSPSASVSKSGSTTTITITDKNGTTTAEVHDGQGGTGTIDPTPTEGSTNAVSSGGVYTELTDVKGSLNQKYEKPSTGIPASDIASGVIPDVSGKADKVQNATSGNFASLDANGNLSDSGHKHSDYLTEAPVTDVQVNGTSILDAQGVANIPKASSSTLGVVITNPAYGIHVTGNGYMYIVGASVDQAKAGTVDNRAVTPSVQHRSAFYGLAKAAGDTSQSSSSNAVGTYTDEAKIAIQKMLGIYEAPWELIREDLVTNATKADIEIAVDSNGQPFELTDIRLMVSLPQQETEAKVEEYGLVRCYYSDSDNDILYIGAITVAAGASGKGAQVWLEQHDRMIERQYTKFSGDGSDVVPQMSNSFRPVSSSHWELATKSYNKVKICAVTGKCKYYLFGKRKWS